MQDLGIFDAAPPAPGGLDLDGLGLSSSGLSTNFSPFGMSVGVVHVDRPSCVPACVVAPPPRRCIWPSQARQTMKPGVVLMWPAVSARRCSCRVVVGKRTTGRLTKPGENSERAERAVARSWLD